MFTNLLRAALFIVLLSSCASSRNDRPADAVADSVTEINLPEGSKPDSLTNLARTEEGAFILSSGFYEAEFKTYCLQPGTPDPTPNDAYLQAPVSGYRREIIETVLYNSRNRPDINQRNVQLLLWSIVSGSHFDRLSPAVRADASQLLTSKQIFELRGGVLGMIKTVSNNLPSGIANGTDGVRRLFETGANSYESFERMAVLREPAKARKAGFKNDQWYKQKQNYYVRYTPLSYQKVRIQVYVPQGIIDADGKANGEYIVFDPTGWQAVPANSNAQRLGIGGPVWDIVKVVIRTSKQNSPPKRLPENKKGKENIPQGKNE